MVARSSRPETVDMEQGWSEIKSGIDAFLEFLEGTSEQPANASDNMGLYTKVYNMCTQKTGDCSEKLYARYKNVFEEYISKKVISSLKESHDEYFLKTLVERWKNHKLMTKWMAKIFNYLDRYYIVRYNLPKLQNVGTRCFRATVYKELHVKTRLAVLKEMEKDREGEIVDADLLRDTLSIFQEVGMGTMDAYKNDFEVYMLESTGEYYQKCASAWIQEDSTPDYLRKAEARLLEEEARVDKYLHVEGKANLLKKADSKLLEQHQAILLEKPDSGLNALLKDNRCDDIARMFRLFSRLNNGLEPMARIFKAFIVEAGAELIEGINESVAQSEIKKETGRDIGAKRSKESSVDNKFIRKSIELHDRFLDILKTCFDSSPVFHKALKEAFESFFNKSVAGHSVPELMASFSDAVLKKGGAAKLLGEDDVDSVLDKLVKFMEYISDRDMFSEFYRQKLSRRLLNANSSGEDAEKGMLSRLKQQCGPQFTSKMEGMVSDLLLAKEKEQDFVVWLGRNNIELPFDMNVTVLTTGHWPNFAQVDLSITDDMVQALESFSKYYFESNKSRKLSWQFEKGSVSMRAHFNKTYDLILSPIQAMLLACFNRIEGETATFHDLQEMTKLTDEILLRNLHSLSLNKYKLLSKIPADKKITKDCSFEINAKFSDKQRRIRLQAPPIDDRKKVKQDVNEDRKMNIDAAIVRIMKSRKSISHMDLMGELIPQLQRMFTPDVKMIKRQIESLIERDYMERDTSNSSVYKYVA
jgi:cullin 1